MKRVMPIRIETAAVFLAAVLVTGTGTSIADKDASATDKAKAPSIAGARITSWSNTRTKDRDRVFLVKSAEKITFSIKVDGARHYQWRVDKEVSENANGNSFQWTVPDKKGIWKICVRATNTDQDKRIRSLVTACKALAGKKLRAGNWDDWTLDPFCPSRSRHEWIVSTFLKKTSPGQSIQAAINSVPPEGGIVELAAGTHTVKATIHITRSNIALIGAGMDKTILVRAAKGISPVIDINKSGDAKARAAWHYNNKNDSWLSSYPRKPLKLNDILKNVTVGYMCIRGGGEHSNDLHAIAAAETVDSVISDVRTENHDQYGIQVDDSINTVVRRCSSNGDGGAVFMAGDVSCHIVECSARGNWRYDCFQTNGWWYSPYTELPEYPCSSVLRNSSIGGPGGFFIYSTTECLVSENTSEKAKRYGMSLTISRNCLVAGNILRGCRQVGLNFHHRDIHPYHNDVVGNFIYGNSGDGIRLKRGGAPLTANIVSNIIWANGGDGINPQGGAEVMVRNNIIANNKGVGIRGAKYLSCNDVWNNEKGNYKGCSAGAGDISKNPLFADPADGDFHLKSRTGRWNPKAKKWVKDTANSPCIDAGDPKSKYKNERPSNGGRINMGAYGNTIEASRSLKERK